MLLNKVVLDRHAWYTRLHEFYNDDFDIKDVKNYCPFFWSTVGEILLFPIALPTFMIFDRARKVSYSTRETLKLIITLIGVGAAGLGILSIAYWAATSGMWLPLLGIIGVIGVVSTAIIGLFILGEKISETSWYQNRLAKSEAAARERFLAAVKEAQEKGIEPPKKKVKKNNIILAALKSWYHRNCPSVEWV